MHCAAFRTTIITPGFRQRQQLSARVRRRRHAIAYCRGGMAQVRGESMKLRRCTKTTVPYGRRHCQGNYTAQCLVERNEDRECRYGCVNGSVVPRSWFRFHLTCFSQILAKSKMGKGSVNHKDTPLHKFCIFEKYTFR